MSPIFFLLACSPPTSSVGRPEVSSRAFSRVAVAVVSLGPSRTTVAQSSPSTRSLRWRKGIHPRVLRPPRPSHQARARRARRPHPRTKSNGKSGDAPRLKTPVVAFPPPATRPRRPGRAPMGATLVSASRARSRERRNPRRGVRPTSRAPWARAAPAETPAPPLKWKVLRI